MAEKSHFHDGHRNRLKERYRKEGLAQFEEHNILELLLFYPIPRRDTNEIAHRLIDRFGSLAGVFRATYEELLCVEGVGPAAAAFLTMIPASMREAGLEELRRETLTDTESAARYMIHYFRNAGRGTTLLVALNARGHFLDECLMACGKELLPADPVKEILEAARRMNAASVLLAHNHACGILKPSVEDIKLTSDIRAALSQNGIRLAGHFIVHGNDWILCPTGEP